MPAPDKDTLRRQLLLRARALEPVATILAEAADLGTGGVYLVGGTARDLLIGRELVDIDLAVDGDALKLASALGEPDGTESQFGTLRVTRDGVRYDLARTRAEHYAHPGALPDVRPARIDEDVSRRDFTVNAIALGLTGERAGELIAAGGALEDLHARRLAVLHDRSFIDDPTRLVRLARYAARLGFELAPRARELAAQAIAGGALATVSGTRVGNELRLLANEPDPIAAFESAAALGLPWTIAAPLAAGTLKLLPPDGRRDIVVLAAVGLGEDLDRLGFTASDRDAIAEAATHAQSLARRLADATSGSEIARAVGTSGLETVALAACQGAMPQALGWLQDLRRLKLQITGEDLIAAGIPEGPKIGHALQAARDAMYDGEATDRDAQLAVALKAAE